MLIRNLPSAIIPHQLGVRDSSILASGYKGRKIPSDNSHRSDKVGWQTLFLATFQDGLHAAPAEIAGSLRQSLSKLALHADRTKRPQQLTPFRYLG